MSNQKEGLKDIDLFQSPIVFEHQQAFNYRALTVLLYGATVSRLQEMQEAYNALEAVLFEEQRKRENL